MSGSTLSGLLVAVLAASALQSAGVPGWRGESHGVFKDANPPLKWDDRSGIRWVAMTGTTGYASPVVTNGKVFVVGEPDELYAVDLSDGKVLWKRRIAHAALDREVRAKLAKSLSASGAAAATPCAFEGRVYVVLGSGVVGCFREDGAEVWTTYLDQPMSLPYGRSASPLLAGGKLLVMAEHLTALDPADGKVVWEAKQALSAYGTPARASIGEVEVVVTPNGDVVRVADGRILLKEVGRTQHTTPLVQGDVIYFVDQVASAVRLPSRVQTTMEVKRLWTSEIEGETYASPVLHEGRLHTINGHGTYRVLDAVTGKVLLEKETELDLVGDEPAHLYPSVTLAGGYLFIANDMGVTVLLEPGTEYREVRRNRLATGAGSSPVLWGRHLLLRGEGRLFCIGPR